MAATHTPSRTSRSPLGLVAGATVVAALAAFLAGRLTGDAASPRAERRGDRGDATAATVQPAWTSEPTRRVEPPRAVAPPAVAQLQAPATAMGPSGVPTTLPLPGLSSPAVTAATAQATTETLQQLQAAKQDLVARCWPAGGLPGGRANARITFSVSYDAYGREVGRGISDPRRAPAGELTRCLSRQPLGLLRVSPPGSAVSVRVALNMP